MPPKPAATSMLTFTKQQKKTDLDDTRAPAPAPVPAPTPEPQMAAVDTPVSSTMIEAESPFTRVRKCVGRLQGEDAHYLDERHHILRVRDVR